MTATTDAAARGTSDTTPDTRTPAPQPTTDPAPVPELVPAPSGGQPAATGTPTRNPGRVLACEPLDPETEAALRRGMAEEAARA